MPSRQSSIGAAFSSRHKDDILSIEEELLSRDVRELEDFEGEEESFGEKRAIQPADSYAYKFGRRLVDNLLPRRVSFYIYLLGKLLSSSFYGLYDM